MQPLRTRRGWPLVNPHNRRAFMERLPEPGLLTGIVPAGPPGTIEMLRDYTRPEERVVARPNQDIAYGFWRGRLMACSGRRAKSPQKRPTETGKPEGARRDPGTPLLSWRRIGDLNP